MERNEVAAVLAYIGRLDPRTIRTGTGEARDQIAQWHELLHDVPFTTDHGWDVRETIRTHVLDSPYPILPVDVARKWRAYRRDRLDRHTDPTPVADPDDPAAWQAELLGTRHAVAAGVAALSTHRQITSGGPHPDVEARLRAIGSCIPPAVRAQLAPYRPARAARETAVAEGRPDALSVRCQWCQAPEGEPCRSRRVGLDGRARGSALRATPHPTRVDLAAAGPTRQRAA
ncbi:zinc finger domain-containing protein [Streptomyces prasinus]